MHRPHGHTRVLRVLFAEVRNQNPNTRSALRVHHGHSATTAMGGVRHRPSCIGLLRRVLLLLTKASSWGEVQPACEWVRGWGGPCWWYRPGVASCLADVDPGRLPAPIGLLNHHYPVAPLPERIQVSIDRYPPCASRGALNKNILWWDVQGGHIWLVFSLRFVCYSSVDVRCMRAQPLR